MDNKLSTKEMKKVALLLFIAAVLWLICGSLMAQDTERIHSPLSETEIYGFIRSIKPGIKTGHRIAILTSEALNEWVDAITSQDTSAFKSTFIFNDTSHVIICNAWLSKEAEDKRVLDMIFSNTMPMIIRNNGDLTLTESINNSAEVGVSFLHVKDKDPNNNVDIYLILLR